MPLLQVFWYKNQYQAPLGKLRKSFFFFLFILFMSSCAKEYSCESCKLLCDRDTSGLTTIITPAYGKVLFTDSIYRTKWTGTVPGINEYTVYLEYPGDSLGITSRSMVLGRVKNIDCEFIWKIPPIPYSRFNECCLVFVGPAYSVQGPFFTIRP